MSFDNYVFIDTETTGFSPDTEDLLEIAIVDASGTVLVDTLVRPEKRQSWPEAMAVHQITPEAVENAPSRAEVAAWVEKAVAGKEVVFYNKKFDAPFLGEMLTPASGVHCAMIRFAEHIGDFDDEGKLRWKRLSAAAEAAGHVWSGNAHRALADAKATRSVWLYLDQLD